MSKHICGIKEDKTKLYPEPLQAWCKSTLFNIFSNLQFGRLSIDNCGQFYEFGRQQRQKCIHAAVAVHDPCFYPDVLFKGSLGAAESYIKGYWSTDNLTDVVRLFVTNIDLLNRQMDGGWSRLTAPLLQIYHWLRKNTYRGSKKNIVAHYDLSNEFFQLFLDRTMGYSCGIFEKAHSSLYEAQVAKFDRICKKLDLSCRDHVVEIGGGWGGFADYRKLTGRYDKLVSIEMIEAVGHQFLDTFFEKCSRLLKPKGMMALQAITIPDNEFSRHKNSVDFIKRYIFPGSCIPSVAVINTSIKRKTDLQFAHFEDITPHYATTLRLWRERFFANVEKVRALGFSESFIRMWEFYLTSCEGSFQERYNRDVQIIFNKP
jgi:cyclopropane-fatty-acyl-phospholipid synthase